MRNERTDECSRALASTQWGKLRGAVQFVDGVVTAHHRRPGISAQPKPRPGLLPDDVEGKRADHLRSSSDATLSNPQARHSPARNFRAQFFRAPFFRAQFSARNSPRDAACCGAHFR